MARLNVRLRGVLTALVIGALAVVVAGRLRPAFACTPCPSTLSLAETIDRADLIVVGSRVGDGPMADSGPDWIEVQPAEILRGEAGQGRLRVNSFDGMCGYGIVVERNAPTVMLLQREGEMYDAVASGCSVSQLPVEGDAVSIDGEAVPLDDFVLMLGPGAARTPVEPPGPVWQALIIPAGLCLIVAALGLLTLRLLRRRRRNA